MNPMMRAGGILVGLSTTFLGIILLAQGLNQDAIRQVQALRQHNKTKVQTFAETQVFEAEQEQANLRYQQNCVILDGQIEEDLEIIGVTDDTQVCDLYGLTAVVKNGIATAIARTVDEAVIQARSARK